MIATWRAMLQQDAGAIHELSERVHPDYPEDRSVFEEKLRLFPFGCLTLDNDDGRVIGYCFSHPWTKGVPPALDAPLNALPKVPTTYFIHDVAVDPAWQKRGSVVDLMPIIADVTRLCRLRHQTLVAVHHTEAFWKRFGFIETPDKTLQVAVREKYSAESTHMEAQIDAHFATGS